ncbi:MAG: sodium:solute symporter family protein [Acidobacteriota bacterium]|jgi:SSS family solute:Na+ symporter
MTITVLAVYLLAVLTIGLASHRGSRPTGEDYFVAGRTIGPFVLLMSLFGTNMTSFTILGASGEAYHTGIGTFAKMASISALLIPATTFFVGTRLWALGKRHGFVTQVEFFRARWESDRVGLLLFLVLVALLVPYILIGVMAGGVIIQGVTGAPLWVGNLVITVVVLAYVLYSGMRGTARVNTFQTLVFMVFGATTVAVVVYRMGGLGAAMATLGEVRPEVLAREGLISPVNSLTYLFMPLSMGMFPHIFAHWLTAKRASHFRYTVTLMPLCIAFVWLPMVVMGVLGNIDFPGLRGPEANSILIRMIDLHAPGFLVGFLAAGVFAASMSSLDSQVLSLGTMFTQDIVRHYGFQDRMSERQVLLAGRLFVAAILLLTFVISIVTDRSIFKLGIWSFTGFAALFPVVLAALFWRRSTKHGAMAAILAVAALWTWLFLAGRNTPNYTLAGTGVMPVTLIIAASAAAMVVVSLLTAPPTAATVERFFPSRPAEGS